MSLNGLVTLLMEVTGRRRIVVHVPTALATALGAVAETIPAQLFSRDTASFLMTDYVCDNRALLDEFKVTLTRPRTGINGFYLLLPIYSGLALRRRSARPERKGAAGILGPAAPRPLSEIKFDVT